MYPKQTKIQHKRGDTFIAECIYQDDDGEPINLDETNTTVASQIRTVAGDLVATLTFTPADQDIEANVGKYTLRADATQSWPVGPLLWDIQYSDGDEIASTQTIQILLVEDITR